MTAPDRFNSFAAIDWSGAVGPRQRGIAVALCPPGDAAPSLVRPAHVWSRAEVLAWMLDEMPAGTLVGLDLGPALPFIDCGAYFPGWERTPGNARALWHLVEAICADEPNLTAAHFVDHEQASRYFRRHGGRTGDRFGSVPGGRLRVVEAASRAQGLVNPYSNLNLVGAAQVGKSSLTGMRLFHRTDGRLPFWPFDADPGSGSLIVEIYTSIAAGAAGRKRGRAKMRDAAALDAALVALSSAPHAPLARYDDHATDALLTAAWLRHAHADAALWHPRGLTPHIAATEGWTFGVA